MYNVCGICSVRLLFKIKIKKRLNLTKKITRNDLNILRSSITMKLNNMPLRHSVLYFLILSPLEVNNTCIFTNIIDFLQDKIIKEYRY